MCVLLFPFSCGIRRTNDSRFSSFQYAADCLLFARRRKCASHTQVGNVRLLDNSFAFGVVATENEFRIFDRHVIRNERPPHSLPRSHTDTHSPRSSAGPRARARCSPSGGGRGMITIIQFLVRNHNCMFNFYSDRQWGAGPEPLTCA